MKVGFEKLDVWKRSVELSANIYRETMEIKDYGFRDQITRSGLSIPSNIAEGMERSSSKERIKFLDYAKASCGELRTQTIIGSRVGFIDESKAEEWISESKEISAMIVGLVRSFGKV